MGVAKIIRLQVKSATALRTEGGDEVVYVHDTHFGHANSSNDDSGHSATIEEQTSR